MRKTVKKNLIKKNVSNEVVNEFKNLLPSKIEELCNKDTHIKAVFYSKNFGYAKGTFYCFQQAKGDCAIILHADLQKNMK